MADRKPHPVLGSLVSFEAAQERATAEIHGLTDMQRKYVEARLSGMIPLHAGKASGMVQPEVNAYRMEKHPKIQKALGLARQMIQEKFDVDRDDVLRGMFDAVQAAGNATELVAAWREIGRIVGVYEPARVDVMHRIEDVTLDKLQRLSTKELIELAEGKDFVIEREHDPFSDEYDQVRVAVDGPRQITRDTDDEPERELTLDDLGDLYELGEGGSAEETADA